MVTGSIGKKGGFTSIFGSLIIRVFMTAFILSVIVGLWLRFRPTGPSMKDRFDNFMDKVRETSQPGGSSEIIGTGKVSFSIPSGGSDASGVILQIYGETSGGSDCIKTLNELNDSNKFLEFFPKNLNEAYSIYREKYILCMATLGYKEKGREIEKGIETFSGNPKGQATELCKKLGTGEFAIEDNSMVCKPIPGEAQGNRPLYFHVFRKGPLKWISSGPNGRISFASIQFERGGYDSQRINMSYILG